MNQFSNLSNELAMVLESPGSCREATINDLASPGCCCEAIYALFQ